MEWDRAEWAESSKRRRNGKILLDGAWHAKHCQVGSRPSATQKPSDKETSQNAADAREMWMHLMHGARKGCRN